MNYRLGTLGFLSGIDDEHRGNFGVRQGSTDLILTRHRLLKHRPLYPNIDHLREARYPLAASKTVLWKTTHMISGYH